MNSLGFCLFRNIFISPLFLNDSFTRYRIPGWQLPSFNILNILFHTLLAWKVSLEKSADCLIGVLLYGTSSLAVLKTLCFWLLTVYLQYISVYPYLCSTNLGPLGLMNLDVHFFPQVWKIFSIYCFKLYVLSPLPSLLFLEFP